MTITTQQITTPRVTALVTTITTVLSILISGLAFAPAAIASASTPPATDWTYQDISGPDHWAELDPSFTTCASGQSQSPVNLTAATSADLVDPEFHYQSVPLNLLNNGHTVQVPYAPGSYVLLDGEPYNLLQFHFHSPSEHTVEGKPWDAELHLVHQNKAGELAVIAVLLQADAEIEEEIEDTLSYNSLSLNLPRQAGDKVRTGQQVNAKDLLPATTTTYRYIGSLTTPPCSESVTWLVMSEPITLSARQLSRYQTRLNHNNRPLQSLNNRAVQIDISN